MVPSALESMSSMMGNGEGVSIRPVLERLDGLAPGNLGTLLSDSDCLSVCKVDERLELFLTAIANRLHASLEAEKILGEQARRDAITRMNLEQLLKNSETRQKANEVRMSELEHSLVDARQQLQTMHVEGQSEGEQVKRLGREIERLQAEVDVAKGKTDRTEIERAEIVRVLERKQAEMDSLNGSRLRRHFPRVLFSHLNRPDRISNQKTNRIPRGIGQA